MESVCTPHAAADIVPAPFTWGVDPCTPVWLTAPPGIGPAGVCAGGEVGGGPRRAGQKPSFSRDLTRDCSSSVFGEDCSWWKALWALGSVAARRHPLPTRHGRADDETHPGLSRPALFSRSSFARKLGTLQGQAARL